MMTISLISATPSTRAEISTSKYARQTTSATPISASQSQLTCQPYCSQLRLRERREAAEQGDAEDRVADHQRVAGHQAPGLPEAVADVGVHAAGRAHLLGHLGVRDREDREHDRREEERRRAVAARAVRHRERRVVDEDRERGRPRHAQEEDAVQPDSVPLELVDVTARGDVDVAFAHRPASCSNAPPPPGLPSPSRAMVHACGAHCPVRGAMHGMQGRSRAVCIPGGCACAPPYSQTA